MRNLSLAIIVALCLTFALTYGASAHTAHPLSHGGGCSTSTQGGIKMGACINHSNPFWVNVDAYITMSSSIANDPNCGVTLWLYNTDPNAYTVDQQTYGCKAGNNVYYSGFSYYETSGNYYLEVGAGTQSSGGYQRSPTLYL